MNNVTIVLADDHQIVRQGLRGLLEAETQYQVVGEAGDGREAVALVERLSPTVLIVDLMMPGLNGLEVARRVNTKTRVVVLSMHANESYVVEALRANVYAYVLKDSSSADIIHAVRETLAGRRYLSPPLSERAIKVYLQHAGSASFDPVMTLTPREREVLRLAAEGFNNTEIAQQLSISPRTAETHRASLMRKLELQNQTDLIRYALRQGIISMDG